jgi:hypothetical protein
MKMLKRLRVGISEPYVYYEGRASGRLDHLIALNWVYTWLRTSLPSWELLERWDYEQDYGLLQCDAFAAIRNTMTKTTRYLFVELDRSENTWDKTVKYNKLYASGACDSSWWGKTATRFPTILCVTTSKTRAERIRQSVTEENQHGLRFEVRLLEQIRKEAYPWA